MSSSVYNLFSSIRDFFGNFTIINQSDSKEIKKIIYCILCLNKFICLNFDGVYVNDVVMYIISIMPYKKIEINAKSHCGVVISSESLFRTSTYVFDKTCELSHTVHDDLNLNKVVVSNIQSLLLDKEYLMMLTIDTRLIVKRNNCEQEILLSGVKSISHSKLFMFAVLTNGDLYEWDRDLFRKSNFNRSLIPGKIILQNVMMIKCSSPRYMCAITNNFELYTWGMTPERRIERLQKKSEDSIWMPQKYPLSNILNIVSADCGEEHICVLSKEGEVYTWGINFNGQLGLNDRAYRLSPGKINLTDVVAVGCGLFYSMVLTKFGTIYMWGSNIAWKLDLGLPACIRSPTKLDLFNVVSISCGDEYVMALTTENVVYMWGYGIKPHYTKANMYGARIPYQFCSHSRSK